MRKKYSNNKYLVVFCKGFEDTRSAHNRATVSRRARNTVQTFQFRVRDRRERLSSCKRIQGGPQTNVAHFSSLNTTENNAIPAT